VFRNNTSIRRKLIVMILLTSAAVLFLSSVALITYDFFSFRQAIARNVATLGQVIAANSAAALAFENKEDAREILHALKAERHIVAAGLYDARGALLATYPADLPPRTLPSSLEADGYYFEHAALVGLEPVHQGPKRWGTLYLKSDLTALYERLRIYSGIAAAVIAVSFFVAYLLSRMFQQQISRPILALSDTARAVSDRRDYSVRAPQMGGDELGLLTDTFNQMLTQIQQQDRTVRDSEARVRAVLNSAISAVIVIDVNGKIIDWNPRAERIFGWTRAEALGQELEELIIPPDYQQAHRRGLDHFQATGEGPVLNRLIELTALRRNGTEFPVELSVSPMHTDGAVTFCGFITDITERKREEKVRAQLASIVESSEDAIISKTLDGVITSWNPGAEKLFGYTAHECIGQPMLMLFPPELADEERGILSKIVAGETADHFDTVRVARDGRRVDVSVTISPIRGNQGDVVGASTIAHDIADRKQADSKLNAQLSRLDLLQRITRAIGERQDLRSIFQVVIRSLEDSLPIDFGCICLYEPAEQVLTVTSVGVRSRALAMELAIPEQARIPIDQNGLSRCVQGELVYEPDIALSSFAFPSRLARGGLRSLVVAPLLAESRVFGVLVAARQSAESFSSNACEFLRQLSEHVALAAHQAQLYSTLQQAYEDLRQSQHTVLQQERLRALGQMASGVAHDINNALSPVALYTDSLLEHEAGLSDRGRGQLTTIQRAIGDVAQTVGRMREFCRPRESQFTLVPTDLNRIVREVIELTRVRWRDIPQERGIVIDLRTELVQPVPSMVGTEGDIRDALTNLIFNAVDAMPEGGVLTVRTRLGADSRSDSGAHVNEQPAVVHLEVSDTGVGMEEETRRHCLEPFFTTKGERGTGLGLAMVYGMVQRHNAELEIDSAPGQGTTVRISFPLAPTAVDGTIRLPALPQALGSLDILIVDDDPLIIESLRATLQSDGHRVTAADGGQAGIDAILAAQQSGERYCMVITDLGMPYVDGRRVAAAVKTASPATPVILLTGWGQRLVDENEIPMNVDFVLNKPPKLRELRAALAELVIGGRCEMP
jgi:PAS domain S-box-containing protein